ncbi:MAG: DMT family transporter [Sphaerochaetaceae bacterium]|nr:DMT family transporter [Sphaerochaetaceae bacterium]
MKKNKFLYLIIPAVFVNILWGSPFALIKLGYSAFGITSNTGSKLLFAGIRFFLAGILIILFGSIKNKTFLKPTKKNISGILLLSLTQTVLLYSFFYIGLSNSSGAFSAIINSSSVFFSVIFASIFFKDDKITLYKVAGSLIGFCGVVIASFNGGIFSFHWNGEFLIFLNCICFAISGVISKKVSQRTNSFTVAGYNLMFGGLILCLIGMIGKGKLVISNDSALWLLLVLATISAISFSIWTKLLQINKVGEVNVFQFVVPVSGIFFSGIFLGEDIIQIRYLIAVILITFGIFIVFSKDLIKK